MRRLVRGSALLGLFTLSLAGPLAACGDDERSSHRDDETSTTEAPDTTLSPEAEVEEAYLAFADMGARLLENPDPEDPEIEQRTTGKARDDLIEGLTTLVTAGQRYELGPEYSQEVLNVRLHDATALAEVCVVEDSSRIESATGRVLASGVTTVDWSVTLTRDGDAWLVEEIAEGDVREGSVECT